MVAVLGKNVQVDTSISAVLSDILGTGATLPQTGGSGSSPGSSGGTVPAQVAAYLAQAQTDYQNALAALKAQNLAGYQSDVEAMSAALTAAQNLLPTSGHEHDDADHGADGQEGEVVEGDHDVEHVERHGHDDLEHDAGQGGRRDDDLDEQLDDEQLAGGRGDDVVAAAGLGAQAGGGLGRFARLPVAAGARRVP